MTRFHFNTKNGQCFVDEEGTVLSDVGSAKVMAVRILSEQLQGNTALLLNTGQFTITVSDESGATIMTLNASISVMDGAGGP